MYLNKLKIKKCFYNNIQLSLVIIARLPHTLAVLF